MVDKLINKDGVLTWNTGEVFKGRIVPQRFLEEIWEDLRKELKEKGYSTQFTKMPEIRAIIVDPITFKRVSKVVDGLPAENLENAGRKDRSKFVPIACQLEFVNDNDGSKSHLIIMPNSKLHTLNETAQRDLDNITHELLHVWEDILLLYPGTLTEDFERSLR